MKEDRKSAVRIDLSKGIVELEGSEEFLKNALVEVRDIIGRASSPKTAAASEISASSRSDGTSVVPGTAVSPVRRTVKRSATNAYVPPLPFDLRGIAGQSSLPEFFRAKSPPQNHEKQITVIVYWLNRYGGIDAVLPGHLMYAYQELGLERPGNPYAALTNTKTRSRTIVVGVEPGSVRINNSGATYVEGLPRTLQ